MRIVGPSRKAWSVAAAVAVVVLTAGTAHGSHVGAGKPEPAWSGFAANAQHTAVAAASPQPLNRIHWHVPVDLRPVRLPPDGTFAHYASPMITSRNTVIVPTRIGARQGFKLVAYEGADGTKIWQLRTDFTVPPEASRQFPGPLPASLIDDHRVAVAGTGGTILVRTNVDHAHGGVRRLAFYGLPHWRAHRAAYRAAVHITTPLTTGPDGSLYFGFSATKDAPDGLTSGVARISISGHGSWVSARALAARSGHSEVALNCAPALSPDGRTGYVALMSGDKPLLVGFAADNLKPQYRHGLSDPQTGRPADIYGGSSATPTVGPDGDVFYGVLGNPLNRHHARGWLLHFDSRLRTVKTPGSFGWDQTVSVVPSSAVSSYHGSSPYLLVSKYNNYGPRGNGRMELALLDPHAAQHDRFSRVQVLREVRIVVSPLHPPHEPRSVRYEWCINSIAVDPATGVAIANNEDGHVYRWDLSSGKLTDNIRLNKPRGQAYTSTLIGPDGTSYAIENGTLYAVGR